MNDLRDTQRSEDYLTDVYNTIKTKLDLKNKTKIENQDKDAKMIEDFLNYVFFQNKFKVHNQDFVKEFENDMIVKAIKEKLGANGSFITQEHTGTAFETRFQEGMQEIFTKALTLENGKEVILGEDYLEKALKEYQDNLKEDSKRKAPTNLSMGLVTASIDTTLGLDPKFATKLARELAQEEYEKMYNYAKQWDEKNNSKTSYGSFNTKQQKIDMANGFKINLDVGYTIDPNIQRILNLLSECTFSAKAYQKDTWDYSIILGQSNPYRVFLETSVAAGQNVEITNLQWYRFLHCLDADHLINNEDEAGLYFYRLRYIYELTGFGQNIDQEKLRKVIEDLVGGNAIAHYIIIFNNKFDGKRRNKITVRSTKQILSKFVDKLTTKKDWSIDTLKQDKSYILYSRMKIRTMGIEWDELV